MITKKVIRTLYKKYKKQPESPDCLDMELLFESGAAECHVVSIDMDESAFGVLEIGSVDSASPFHRLPLNGIHAIVPFEEWIAIVMPSAIVFLSRATTTVNVHVRTEPTSLWQRIKDLF